MTQKQRAKEVREILALDTDELVKRAKGQLILRIAALGKPGDDYPVTHARYHKSLRIVSDYGTAQKPKYNI